MHGGTTVCRRRRVVRWHLWQRDHRQVPDRHVGQMGARRMEPLVVGAVPHVATRQFQPLARPQRADAGHERVACRQRHLVVVGELHVRRATHESRQPQQELVRAALELPKVPAPAAIAICATGFAARGSGGGNACPVRQLAPSDYGDVVEALCDGNRRRHGGARWHAVEQKHDALSWQTAEAPRRQPRLQCRQKVPVGNERRPRQYAEVRLSQAATVVATTAVRGEVAPCDAQCRHTIVIAQPLWQCHIAPPRFVDKLQFRPTRSAYDVKQKC